MHELCDVRVLARPTDVEPTAEGHRVIGVLNPGSARVDGQTRLLLRVIEAHEQNAAYHEHFRSGSPLPDHVYLPRAQGSGVHWEKKRLGADVEANDSYSVRLPGLVEVVRPTVIAHARLAKLRRENENAWPELAPVRQEGLFPHTAYEEFGIEDPRVMPLPEPLETEEGFCDLLVSYVACSGIWGVSTAFALSNDLSTFHRYPTERPSPVFHPPQKDVVVFPQRMCSPRTGRPVYWAIIRPGAAHRYISPSMFMVCSEDLLHWGNPVPLVAGTSEGHVGAGVPPLETDAGWLLIYHGRTVRDGGPRYEGWAALLDRNRPWTSIHRSQHPMLRPIDTGEENVIPDVAFPTGAHILPDGTLEVFLGLNDAVTAVARAPLSDVMAHLKG